MAKVPWQVKDGIYYLKDDSRANRKLLRKHISKQVLKNRARGVSNTEGFATVFLGKDGIPHRLGSVDKFISGDVEYISFRNKETAKKAKLTKDANMTQPNDIVLDWVENLNRKKAWPKGKSLDGFIQWAVDNYKGTKSNAELIESLTGILSDAGHATDKGFSSITGLAPQPRYDPVKGNQNLKHLAEEFKDTDRKAKLVKGPGGKLNFVDELTGKPINPERGTIKKATDNVRTIPDLEAIDIGFTPHKAFEEYLNIDAKDLNILTQEGWDQAQKTATLFDPEYAPTALSADTLVRDELLNRGVTQQTLKNNPVGSGIPKIRKRHPVVQQAVRLIKAGGVEQIIKPLKSFAATGADTASMLIPSESTYEKLKTEETRAEGIEDYKGEVTSTATITGLTLAGMKGLSKLPITKGVIAKTGAANMHPLVGIATAMTIANEVDDVFFDSKGKEALKKSRASYLNPLLGEENVQEGLKQYDKNRDEDPLGSFAMTF